MRRMYKHQRQAFAYTLQVQNPALFMDMRLGKTLIVIRRVKLYSIKDYKVLVVCPVSAIGSWMEELELEGEAFVVLRGTRKQRREQIYDGKECNWFLLNKEGYQSIPELATLPWDVVVWDESHWIKNPKAHVTRFYLQNFRRTKHRWVLTGTPNPEHDLEFVCQMLFLNGAFCDQKDYWKFRTEYFKPGPFHTWIAKPGARETMQKELAEKSFIMKRKDAGMEKQKIYETRYIEMPKDIRKIYDDFENDFEANINGESYKTIWATQRYIWLRRLCGGFVDKDKDEMVWGGKFVELKNLLEGELKREQVVVWFSFNQELDEISELLQGARINNVTMTGATKQEIRESYRRSFNQGKIRVLLVQQAVAQAGMNLSGADTAIYYSEPTGLTATQQTEDRILSMNKSGPLLYIRLIVRDTVDEDNRRALSVKGLRSDTVLSRIRLKHFRARR